MYTIQYFIDKFEAIPEEKWCTHTQQNDKGQRCAFGHCMPLEELQTGSNSTRYGTETEEGKALYKLRFPLVGTVVYFMGMLSREVITQGTIACVNNGEMHPKVGDEIRVIKISNFPQKTPKQRVLAALRWMQEEENNRLITKALEEGQSDNIKTEKHDVELKISSDCQK